MLSMILAAIEDESDREFMVWVHDEFHRLMFSTAEKYISDPFSREDVVQESLLKLIKVVSLLRTRPRPVLATYIVSTVRNCAINFLKKEARRQGRTFSLDEGPVFEWETRDRPVDEQVILREDLAKLAKVWHLLSESDRFVLEGKYILNCSDEELADCLVCKPSSIRMKLTRACRNAKELMGGRTEEGAKV